MGSMVARLVRWPSIASIASLFATRLVVVIQGACTLRRVKMEKTGCCGGVHPLFCLRYSVIATQHKALAGQIWGRVTCWRVVTCLEHRLQALLWASWGRPAACRYWLAQPPFWLDWCFPCSLPISHCVRYCRYRDDCLQLDLQARQVFETLIEYPVCLCGAGSMRKERALTVVHSIVRALPGHLPLVISPTVTPAPITLTLPCEEIPH